VKSYCSLRNLARKWKTPHGPLARNSPARQAAKRPRSRNRPTARLPSDHAPRARPPCGPRRKSAQRPARARRVPRSRPQLGPGPGKFHPAWAESRSGECEPFILIQRLREVFGRTKPPSGSVAQTLAPFLFSSAPSRAPQRRLRATDERRRREHARGAARAPRRCACSPLVNAPPSSGLSGASTDERRLHRGPAQIHKGSVGKI
jgi:hypothetical protein